MAESQATQVHDETFPAGQDLSSSQYRIVALNSSGQVILPADGAVLPIGILQNAPASGQAATVRVQGRSKCILGGTVAVPNVVMSDAADDGAAILATATNFAVGTCVQGGGDGDMGAVLVNPMLAVL